jgi:mRNA interferase MazF
MEFKKRPVLILSKTKNNELFEDVIICGITANLNKSPYSIFIDNKDLEIGAIPVKSKIKVDKIFTIEKNLIIKKLGKLNKNSFDKIKKEFFKLI